jgi:hypothetical protein
MRLKSLISLGLFAILCGCGGGGGGGSSDTTTTTAATNTACGTVKPAVPNSGDINVQPIVVSASINGTGFVNTLTTTIKVCAQGSLVNCKFVSNVQVDTGSSGLRMPNSVVSVLNLPRLSGANGEYGECVEFADGLVWGGLAAVDVYFTNGAAALNINMQVLNDGPSAGYASGSDGVDPVPPAANAAEGDPGCDSGLEDSVTALGANGIIGVGLFNQDCGTDCAGSLVPQTYYQCPAGTNCLETLMPTNIQVSNPIIFVPTNNNGVILELPQISVAGAESVNGNMVFGIGTATNNVLAASTPVLAVADTGQGAGSFAVTYNGQSGILGFFDSGSSVYFFADSSIPSCTTNTGFFCPSSQITRTLTATGVNSVGGTLSVTLENADGLFAANPNFNAFNDLGSPINSLSISGFDLGMPYFFGNSMYTGFESQTNVTPNGPYFACAPNP